MLTREQADDVLRYWLAGLRLEEALQVRPAARLSAGGASVPRLDQPTPGQTYFKLPLDTSLAELLSKQTQLTRPFDAELSGFFETWLHGQYRRSEDESELSHLLCFPVVHLPKGELAGLLRCGARLRFFAEGDSKAFRVPTRGERQRGSFPPAPDQAQLTRAPKVEGAWPFFIDTRLLRQPLGVPSESIDAFFEALRALPAVSELQMLALLTTLLEAVASSRQLDSESVSAQAVLLQAAASKESCGVDTWLERLTRSMGRLLQRAGSRARVYAVGIVVDGTQAKTSWHLQRELEALLSGDRGRFQLASPLGAYLTGQPLPSGQAPQRALFPGPALSPSQRAAAEGFWGSGLSAVQGPPGTGKTRLILHLCADALLGHVEGLLDGKRERSGLFLITSSNNRAVDNVIEPLSSLEGLPLALRAGSRQVCEHQLLPQLRRALAWLQRAQSEPQPVRTTRLAEVKTRFRERRDAIERRLAPRRAAAERAATRARLEAELAECSPSEAADSLAELRPQHIISLRAALEPLVRRLRALSKLCEAAPAPAAAQAIDVHYKRTQKRQGRAFAAALTEAGLTIELPLPPAATWPEDPSRQMEQWEEAAELCLNRLDELRVRLEQASLAAEAAVRVRRLRAALAALGPDTAPAELVPAAHEHESVALFEAAVAAREAWASERASELAEALSTAIRAVEQERSLRSLFRTEPDAARLLCRLFGIWGSTLLSLGNCFPIDVGGFARVVIDEAGQCHPAHAVSALMRAESALVIGDTLQLTPVIELGADDDARLLRACRLKTPAPRLLPYRVHADSQVSSQSLADRAVATRARLTDHFRCQPEIIAVSDALCGYGLTIHTPRADRSRHAPYLQHAVSLVDLQGEQARLAGSWCNEQESQETLALLTNLLQRGLQADDIAVITPFRGQLEQLRRRFAEQRIPIENSAELAESGAYGQQSRGVALGTVHRFQGGERSIVLFSSVVTLPSSLGFLNARPNLLNVAISRAQHHFICLGHAAVLAQGPRSRLLVDRAAPLSSAAYGGGSSSGPLFAGYPSQQRSPAAG